MGYGKWTADAFASYSTSVGRTYDLSTRSVSGSYSAQEMFTAYRLADELDPKDKIRECRNSEDHPNTKPVILALDVTGSMGNASVEVAKRLNNIMEDLYKNVDDVEFMMMGIGDLDYDNAPIQASQFESDIRIASQLDKLYFEGGGGGNGFESYTAAWYFGLYHTDLDCLKDGRKGTIITLGDEPLNPYLPIKELERVLGSSVRQRETDTKKLYELASKKFNIYHICIKDNASSYRYYEDDIFDEKSSCSWVNVLGRENVIVSTIEALSQNISMLVRKSNSGITTISEVYSIFADNDNKTVEYNFNSNWDSDFSNSNSEGISW